MDLPDLGKQYGPLPLGGWVIALGGGLAVAVFIRRRALSQDEADTIATAAADAAGLSIDGSTGGVGGGLDNTQLGVGGGNTVVPDTSDYDDTVEAPTTNEEWRRQAASVLALHGIGGLAANDALSNYISGYPPTADEQSIVSQAIRLIGAPPNQITAKARPPAPAGPGTLNTGTKGHTYTNNKEWYNAGIKYLTSHERVTPHNARLALKSYLGYMPAKSISPTSASLIGNTITALGPPPVTPKYVPVTAPTAAKAQPSARRDNG